MRKFRVTVNGESYEVEVEETGISGVAPAARPA
ncbi:MAG TPA: acetyl-CoA carboxylase biotin carboxyl carrier protein subunit, partial [Firmicutes bacterium]|nr:acetyl-CoA carboxylase biotin carboxyl carrier protein subunit [Bacillota bacterium]